MKKNNHYEVTVINTRNELADAINARKPFIDIRGETKTALIEEIKAGIKKDKTDGKIDIAAIGFGAVGLLTGNLFLIATGVLNVFLGEHNRAKNDFNHYRLATFSTTFLGDKLFLINTDLYDPKYDTVEGYNGYYFTNKLKCPQCGKRYSKREAIASSSVILCQKCHKFVVFYA